MSVATVVTRGFGSFGSVNLLPTLGYGSAEPPIIIEDGLVIEIIGAKSSLVFESASVRRVTAETIGAIGTGLIAESAGRR